MLVYALRRVMMIIPIALGVTMFCYGLVLMAPGDPVQSMLPADATPEEVAYLKKFYGFDQPVPVQYAKWLARAATGDLGKSIQTSRPVFLEVTTALSNTFIIAVGAISIAFSLAFVMGSLAAWKVGGFVDRLMTGVAVVGISIPNYWLGIVMIIVFSVNMGVLPASGMGTQGSTGFSVFDWGQLKYAVLPMIAMSMVPLGIIMRTTRSAVAEALNQDFIQLLRAKGLGPFAVMRHAIRNALPQVLTVMGLQLGFLVGGSILIETIFNWPGTGFLMSKAILTRDVPLLQGAILVLSMTFVTINLLVDLLQTAIDPRIRRA